MTRYDDIIRHSPPVSARHAPASMWSRASQFAPFAALAGFGDSIEEALIKHIKEVLEAEKGEAIESA